MTEERVIRTNGGDYAEGNIDKHKEMRTGDVHVHVESPPASRSTTASDAPNIDPFFTSRGFFNCVREIEIFTEKMLNFEDSRKICLITSEPRTGKTKLLQGLEWECKRKRILVARLSLKTMHSEHKTPYGFIRTLYDSMGDIVEDFHTLFQRFTPLYDGIKAQDHSRFGFGNASLLSIWTEQHEILAQEKCYKAFLQDIRSYSGPSPIVFLIDGLEAIEEYSKQFQEWFMQKFLESAILKEEKHNNPVVMVITSTKELSYDIERDDYSKRIIELKSISAWNEQAITACLEFHRIKPEVIPEWGKVFQMLIEHDLITTPQLIELIQKLSGRPL